LGILGTNGSRKKRGNGAVKRKGAEPKFMM